ncbi:50S ribosomal protein L18 [Patescibacteria group bacterium]|nr:50S ribosomal protein L18 [Patescibacteria group bacterium]
MNNDKITRRVKRSRRIKARLSSTDLPRLMVHRTLHHFYGQIVDNVSGNVLASASTLQLKTKEPQNNVAGANKIGQTLGQAAVKAGITKVKFDRKGYRYHGQVKAFAEGTKEAGLIF